MAGGTISIPSSFLKQSSYISKLITFPQNRSRSNPEKSEKDREEDSYLSFEPWLKSPRGFAVDVLFSATSYVITYWFLHRIGILHMKHFNNHIRERIKHHFKLTKDKLNKELENFELVLKKSISLGPKGSNNYWRNYYDKYVLDKAESPRFSQWQRFCAKTFKNVYSLTEGFGRLVFVSLIILLSLIRAYAVHPDLSIFKALFIAIGPIITQVIYRKYDAEILKNSPVKELQRLNDLGEVSNFSFKWLSKALKRSENALMFVVALTGSFLSRLVRDGVEGGLPSSGKNGSKPTNNPIFRSICKLPLVENLRNSREFFQKGVLRKYKYGEHHIAYLARIAGVKILLKYATDYLIFGLGGVTMLKLVYSLKHLWENQDSQSKLIKQYQPVITIPSLSIV
ncbi:MAG: hypothetical protein QNJ31_02270 [Candidatus Caenarcaniphilales bacterium]|nr:hypothetical protein [Candidatus Caenarcaniphilales bacterium]